MQSRIAGPKAAPPIHAWLLFRVEGGELEVGALGVSNCPAVEGH